MGWAVGAVLLIVFAVVEHSHAQPHTYVQPPPLLHPAHAAASMGMKPSADVHARYTAPRADRNRVQPRTSSRHLLQEANTVSPALRRHCGGMAREEPAVRTKPYSKPILSCKRTHTDSPDVALVVMVGRHHRLLAPDHIQRMQVGERTCRVVLCGGLPLEP